MNIYIYTFICLAALSAWANTALAQQQSDQQTIEEIVVTASPHKKGRDELPTSVSVLDGEQLQQAMQDTLGATLGSQLGIHAQSFGPGANEPMIRGHSGYRTEILQDGVRLGDVSDTSDDHAVALDPGGASRIEILRGPSALRYGPGAVGGVINVLGATPGTCAPDDWTGHFDLSRNDNNKGTFGLVDLGTGNGTWGVHLQASHRDTDNISIPGAARQEHEDEHGHEDEGEHGEEEDEHHDEEEENTHGYVANTAIRTDNNSLSMVRRTDNGCLRISRNAMDTFYGIPPGGHGHGHGHEDEEEGASMMAGEEEHEDEEEAEINVLVDLQRESWVGSMEHSINGPLWQNLLVQLNISSYTHQEIEREIHEDGDIEDRMGTLFENDETQIRAEMTWSSGEWLGAWGVQYSDRDFSAEGEEAFIPSNTSGQWGLYALGETDIGNIHLELGLRLDQRGLESSGEVGHGHEEGEDEHEDEGEEEHEEEEHGSYDESHSATNLSIGLSAPVGTASRLGFMLSRTGRMPSKAALLANGVHTGTNSYDEGDRDLDNENALNMELSWRWSQGRWQVGAAIYRNDFSNYLYQRDTGQRWDEEHGEFFATADDFVAEEIAEEIAGMENAPDEGTAEYMTLQTQLIGEHGEELEEQFEELPIHLRYDQAGALFSGIEGEAIYNADDWQLRLWTDSVSASLDDGGDVPRMAPARIGADWFWRADDWSLGLSWLNASEQDSPGENQEPTDGYSRLDLWARWQLDRARLFVRASNLTDEEIRNSTSFLRELAPEPGRSIVLGLRYSL